MSSNVASSVSPLRSTEGRPSASTKRGKPHMAKILVTGCRGTLGAPLVAELRRRGNDVWGCDLQHQAHEQFIRADIQHYRQLDQMLDQVGDVDYVYHLAAEFGRINGEEYYDTLWATNV